jgi:tRNA 5-methylaminomethyl-2-thiouridine biosynthesis bifunctional protein
MSFPLVPAELAFAGDGTPYSPRYCDIYHSSQGGLDQARHVFLAGNDLPARWAGRPSFVILEIGFGLGLNFLATLQAWRRTPGPVGRRLHYVALEKHPFRLAALTQIHRGWPELVAEASELQAQWPLPLPGLHRLDFGDIVLTLGFGDAAELLPKLTLAADAIYLDGFAPERNSDVWADANMAELGRLAAPGATLATWSVAGDVRRRLASADFLLERRPGFGGKREMLAGRRNGAVRPAGSKRSRRIAIIGAGIAGATAAHVLAGRGHSVTVLDAAAAPASGASGNLAGVFRPLPSDDDGKLARLLRAGFLLGRRRFANLPEARCGWTGALHIARDERHEATQRRIVDELALPVEFCRYVDRDQAAAIAGWPVTLGGWWFPQAGWINPPSLCRALLAGIDCRFDFVAVAPERRKGVWHIPHGNQIFEADELVLANGIGAAALAAGYQLPIRPGRGLVSHLPEASTPAMEIVATRLGYVTPPIDGLRCAGATLAADDLDPAPRLADHAENLFRLEMLLPGFARDIDAATLGGRVSFRPMSPDRLPLVGPLSASDGLWIINGFGARGLVFASICAELLASQIDGEPLPLESDLVRALDPLRFGAQTSRQRARRPL